MKIDREAVARELLALLDDIEAREAQLKEHTKEARDEIQQLRAQAKERRDILAGKRGVQLPLTAAVLDHAAKVAERKGAQESSHLTHDDYDGAGEHFTACNGCDLDVTWNPGDDCPTPHVHVKPKKKRPGKKFPLGSGLDEKCTACGKELGEHAGQKCPEVRT